MRKATLATPSLGVLILAKTPAAPQKSATIDARKNQSSVWARSRIQVSVRPQCNVPLQCCGSDNSVISQTRRKGGSGEGVLASFSFLQVGLATAGAKVIMREPVGSCHRAGWADAIHRSHDTAWTLSFKAKQAFPNLSSTLRIGRTIVAHADSLEGIHL